MARQFCISISDRPLLKWLEDREKEGNSPSLSLVVRDALNEKKKEWEIRSSEDLFTLHERIESLKKVLGNQSKFISEKGLSEEFFTFASEKEGELDATT